MDPNPNLIVDRFGRYGRRSQSLILDYPTTDRTTRHFTLPEGANILALPKATQLTSAFGRYSSSVKPSKHGIEWNEELVLSATEVAPSDYPKFRQFVEGVAAARGATVRVRLVASP